MTAPKKAQQGVKKKLRHGLTIGDAITIIVLLAFSLFWLWLNVKGMKPDSEMTPKERKQEADYAWMSLLLMFVPPVLAVSAIKKIIWKD